MSVALSVARDRFFRHLLLSALGVKPPFDIMHVMYMVQYRYTYFTYSIAESFSEKLTDFQLVQKFSAFHGTRRFVTAFKSARHLSLSCAKAITCPYPVPKQSLDPILCQSNHLSLSCAKAIQFMLTHPTS